MIRKEDADAFKVVIAPLVAHARIVEAAIGSVTVEPAEIIERIRTYDLPYDPEDIIFMVRFAEAMEQAETCRRAEAIIQRHGFEVAVDELI